MLVITTAETLSKKLLLRFHIYHLTQHVLFRLLTRQNIIGTVGIYFSESYDCLAYKLLILKLSNSY